MDQASLHQLTYQPQEEVENLERYRAGGYHPVNLGDTFSNDRYRIIHKLGWGSYSTVWLARDSVMDRYVALKIIAAAASINSAESRIMRHLHETAGAQVAGSNHVVSLLDEFYIDGPDGRHLCIAI